MDAGQQGEVELLGRLLARDNQAWRVFVGAYRRLIFAKIHRLLRRFPAAARRVDADDVYAALMASLVRNDMQKLRVFDFERGYSLKTWMMTLTTHATLDHVRAAMRRPEDVGALDFVEVDGGEVDALRKMIARDDWEVVSSTMARMPRRDRELVERLFFGEASPEDIAASMGISIKTVYTKKHKIRARFEEQRIRSDRRRGRYGIQPIRREQLYLAEGHAAAE